MDDFSRRMKELYELMDSAYDSVQRHYGFTCEGCADNCCTQRFAHHTLAEYRYLLEGMLAAEPQLARSIITKAREVVAGYEREKETGTMEHFMCPVNFDGLCRLYEHRPMICRMHGLPHRYRRPDGREVRGGGCERFEADKRTDWSVNRTQAYTVLARIEQQERARRHFGGKYARTTAEMIVEMADTSEELRKHCEEQ